MMEHTCNVSVLQVEVGEPLVWGQPGAAQQDLVY